VLILHHKPEKIKIAPIIEVDLPISLNHSVSAPSKLSENSLQISHFPDLNHNPDRILANIVNDAPQIDIVQENIEIDIDVPRAQSMIEGIAREEEKKKINYKSFILIIMTNTILVQFFLILMMIFFIWEMSYIFIVIYLCLLDILSIKIDICAFFNSKYLLFFLKISTIEIKKETKFKIVF
jgi:hypothetical protein